MKCDFCDVKFEKGPVHKTIRGKKFIFCSEYCYVLYHYRIPKFPFERSFGPGSITVPLPDIRQFITKEEE